MYYTCLYSWTIHLHSNTEFYGWNSHETGIKNETDFEVHKLTRMTRFRFLTTKGLFGFVVVISAFMCLQLLTTGLKLSNEQSESANQRLRVQLSTHSTRIFVDLPGISAKDINKTIVETAEQVINMTRTNLRAKTQHTDKTLLTTNHSDEANTTAAATPIKTQPPMPDPLDINTTTVTTAEQVIDKTRSNLGTTIQHTDKTLLTTNGSDESNTIAATTPIKTQSPMPDPFDINKPTVETVEQVIDKTRNNLGTTIQHTDKTFLTMNHSEYSNSTTTIHTQPPTPMRDPLDINEPPVETAEQAIEKTRSNLGTTIQHTDKTFLTMNHSHDSNSTTPIHTQPPTPMRDPLDINEPPVETVEQVIDETQNNLGTTIQHTDKTFLTKNHSDDSNSTTIIHTQPPTPMRDPLLDTNEPTVETAEQVIDETRNNLGTTTQPTDKTFLTTNDSDESDSTTPSHTQLPTPMRDPLDINEPPVETAEQVIDETQNNLGTTVQHADKTFLTNDSDESNTTAATTPMHTQPPMRDPLLKPSNRSQKINLTSEVEYLGVLLDAGRHYFPTEWIYRLLDHLELLGFNLLHFRLTDDQAFNVRFDCHPELAQPATGSNGQVYTPTELRQLVAYAKQKGIVIMPEINVPGHAGGWAGAIPRLVLPCAGFICTAGYGLALNASHPQLIPILRDVLMEVKDIFSTTPFFHLGGDELEMSWDCFQELGLSTIDYSNFENDLGIMLKEIGIGHEHVVRWEMTGQGPPNEQDDEEENHGDREEPTISRVKGIDHYWYSWHYQDVSNEEAKEATSSVLLRQAYTLTLIKTKTPGLSTTEPGQWRFTATNRLP